MKKLILFLTIVLHIAADVNACTVCGCSASNQYLGILPQSQNSFIGFQYQFRAYNSTHMPEDNNATNIKHTAENYRTLQLWGRYNVSRKIQLFAFVPYIINQSVENGTYTKATGVGDVTLLANYRLIGSTCSGGKWQHNLLLGGGVKLPTGKYDSYSIKYNEGLPNMQPGTASYDFVMLVNHTLQHNKSGVNTDVSYVITTSNPDKYKYGNRLQAGLLFFHALNIKQVKIIPQLGARYEIAGNDYDNYSLGLKNDMSGGSQLYGAVGVQASYKKIGLQAMVFKPFLQNYAGGMVTNKYKAETGIYFLF